MDARFTWGPQARISLVSLPPDANTALHRWRADPRPHQESHSALLPTLAPHASIAAFVVPSVLLAWPNFPSAGLMPPASASASTSIIPGEGKGPSLPVRLQVGRHRRGDH